MSENLLADYIAVLEKSHKESGEVIEAFYEFLDEMLERLEPIQRRLHSGSDAMRDEGHKIWLMCEELKMIIKHKEASADAAIRKVTIQGGLK
jgi:hypothetical protein